MKSIYLDYAAATPVSNGVAKTMAPFFSQRFQNPSAIYSAGRKARQDLESARSKVATILGAKTAEIIFTAGATEANNLALQGIMRNYPAAEAVVSAIEHESVLAPARLFKHKLAPVNNQGVTDLTRLKNLVNHRTVLISVMLINNEVGSVQPIKEIAAFLRQVRSERKKKKSKLPIYLHTDAAQAPCFFDLHVSQLGIDLMSLNGGKIYGPKQSGVLYVRAGTSISPIILGGGQEYGLRSGTENLAGCVGLAQGLQDCVDLRSKEVKRVTELKRSFISGLKNIPGAKLHGFSKNAAPHILNISFAGADNERLMMQLDEAGIQVGLGSACSASDLEPSHVLKAMGLNKSEIASSLRFSFGRATSSQDIKTVLSVLRQLTAG